MKQLRFLLLLALWLLPLLAPAALQAQGPSEVTVNDVASELYCPLCSGLTVDVCELEVCGEMRQIIAEKLEAGESPEEIQAYFIEQYGQSVAGKPSTEGFHLTAWLMPFVALLLALGLLAAWLRSRNANHAAPVAVPSRANSDDYQAQLDRELRRLDE
ncbi:MAG: cytochrome c-type biogenesis protein CcmH [Anaerolineales bacterium]|nr:cytochrome c-type biogenesis protein CcmH [Anaerolineales bacterium]MCB9128632.1 cytochrome c-type biogenesis protein CcmH [Ardenticatenales bacterium]